MSRLPEVGVSQSPGRILHVEALDAVGSAAADGWTHATALERGGFAVRTVIIDLRPEHRPRSGADENDPGILGIAEGVAMIHEEARRLVPDLILIAGSEPGGGRIARGLPPGIPARHWPTGFAAAPRLFSGGAPLASIAAPTVDPREAGAEWSVWDRPARRGRQSLWDGDYVVVPSALAGRAGREALGVFAAAAATRNELDLVVLGRLDETMKRRAEELGIDTRVHFAGDAPREAERSWIASASAVLLAEDGPCAGGLVWRTLSAGTPIVALDSGRASREVARWLERHGCAEPRPDGDATRALRRALSAPRELAESIAAGRALAAEHTVEIIGTRLAAILSPPAAPRRAAA